MKITGISNEEFATLQKLIFKEVGITLADSKKTMVQSRLNKRLVHYKLDSFAQYLRIVQITLTEKIEMINLITTNETYFFREEVHFDFVKSLLTKGVASLRIWSAASSVGAEAYSLAMMINGAVGKDKWEIVGSDINSEVIKKAKMGLYPISWITKIPDQYKNRYCLKGKGKYEGQFLIDRSLCSNMHFTENNLLEQNNYLGEFDIVFLRNVLLYFSDDTKEIVVKNVISNLKVGGFLIISLTENINSVKLKNLVQVRTSIFQKIS
ncbi:protein-glutamate O-methyltransferase CheR [bacterium]|nr:protein-glutamate O-methyltransferase CheR [bacterium]MBU1989893.1 protein-glutamate O-methyltransferase CheR [bacterium]